MAYVDEVKRKPWNEVTKDRTESDQTKATGSVEQNFAHDQVMVVKVTNGIPGHNKDMPSSSKKKKQRSESRAERDRVPEIVEEHADDVVQDQIIIAPEVMSLILEELDLRSLKKARLVCKSWLQEAQPHFERRTAVRFQRRGCTARIKSFQNSCQKELMPALPQPFRALDVDLKDPWGRTTLPYKVFLKQLQGIICPPLMLTTFSPGDVPMKFAIPVIIQCSYSLKYLKLDADSCELEYLPEMDPEYNFPKLRHVRADISIDFYNTATHRKHFQSIVAWIINSSPNLEALESECIRVVDLGSELLLKLNVSRMKKLKTLVLSYYELNTAASEHFLSIPFTQLEHLKLYCFHNKVSSEWGYHAAVSTVRKSAATLKQLDLSSLEDYLPNDMRTIGISEFPVCPNVKEFTLSYLPRWMCVISTSFPALSILNVYSVNVNSFGDLWSDLPPFLGIKTLRAGSYSDNEELALKFLEKFPELERMRLDWRTLVGCCRLQSNGRQRFSNTISRVKNLEVGNIHFIHNAPSQLDGLKGIETVTVSMSHNKDVVDIPLHYLPSLKVIEFNWGNGMDLAKLLEMARRVKKVVITNCCSVQRVEGQKSQEILQNFLESASNVVCGCGTRKNPRQ